jgi:hypothetical protein
VAGLGCFLDQEETAAARVLVRVERDAELGGAGSAGPWRHGLDVDGGAVEEAGAPALEVGEESSWGAAGAEGVGREVADDLGGAEGCAVAVDAVVEDGGNDLDRGEGGVWRGGRLPEGAGGVGGGG